jgi:hypothetical protein
MTSGLDAGQGRILNRRIGEDHAEKRLPLRTNEIRAGAEKVAGPESDQKS